MLGLIKKFTPKPFFSLYHLTLAWSGNLLYSAPSKKLFLIGITGTKGKTTTSYFTYQLLDKTGYKTALTSTTFFVIREKFEPNKTKMGMPGRFFLPHFLNKALRKGAEYAVIETTSEGIAQHRQLFLDYNIAVFTSLSPEHIERHGSFTAYRQAKEKLFDQCKNSHVLNLNDRHVKHFLEYPADKKWGVVLNTKIPQSFIKACPNSMVLEGSFSTSSGFLRIKEWNFTEGKKSLVAELETPFKLPGDFNAMNLLLALASARTAGISLKKLVKIVPELELPPGRMQEIRNKNLQYRIFLDYAHEPLSLRSALESCRELLPKGGHLISLTGAQGGGRDKWKRKVMGRTASDLSDYVIISTEDPYEEDPETINKEVLEGVLSNGSFKLDKNCWSFSDRRQAIKKALQIAQPSDILIFCGKGGEKFMCIGDKKIPWDEEREVLSAIKQ